MAELTYGYGHTKEAATIVRNALNDALKVEKKLYGLKISLRKAESSYGGPSVRITTNVLGLDKRYEYIVDENGNPADSGKLVSIPVSQANGRWDRSYQLRVPEETQKLNDKISDILAEFGHDNDDAMTDYFDNTTPLFYGVEYKAAN